jgi:phi LC3 family holin
MINWKVRLNNKLFWMEAIPALALVIQAVAAIFGYTINLDTLVGKILTAVDAIFALLVILGVVVDPTTAGVADSKRAMSYEEPWKDETIEEE